MAADDNILWEIRTEPLNWSEFRFPEWLRVFSRILASLPGGEYVEDVGFEPIVDLGWRELKLLARWLSAIEDAGDVRRMGEALFGRAGGEE